MTDENVLPKQIKGARLKIALSQQQLADLAGTDQATIARLENPKYTGHSLSLLRRIAEAIDCDLQIELKARETNQRLYKLLHSSKSGSLARSPVINTSKGQQVNQEEQFANLRSYIFNTLSKRNCKK